MGAPCGLFICECATTQLWMALLTVTYFHFKWVEFTKEWHIFGKKVVFCYWYTEIFDGAWSGRNSVPPKLLFEGEVSGFIIGKKIFVVLFLMTLVTVTCYNITCLRMWNTHCTLSLWDKTLESFNYLCWWTRSLLLLHLIGTSQFPILISNLSILIFGHYLRNCSAEMLLGLNINDLKVFYWWFIQIFLRNKRICLIDLHIKWVKCSLLLMHIYK